MRPASDAKKDEERRKKDKAKNADKDKGDEKKDLAKDVAERFQDRSRWNSGPDCGDSHASVPDSAGLRRARIGFLLHRAGART